MSGLPGARSSTLRWILCVGFVASSYFAALRWLGSRSEAFWLLVPIWALAGGPVLHVLPPPRRRQQPRLFFLHGTEDTIVPPVSTERLHAAYRGPKRLHLEKGAKHGETAGMDPFRYQREVKEFFLLALP